MKPNSDLFFEKGATHEELATLLGLTKFSLSSAISRGTLPFKRHRVRVGRYWVYDVSACIEAMKVRQRIQTGG